MLGTDRRDLDGPTEFDWGPGLVPPGTENLSPQRGGPYRPKAPKVRYPSNKLIRGRASTKWTD